MTCPACGDPICSRVGYSIPLWIEREEGKPVVMHLSCSAAAIRQRRVK